LYFGIIVSLRRLSLLLLAAPMDLSVLEELEKEGFFQKLK
jgi:hypothetical protein